MKNFPLAWTWLVKEPGPRILTEALRHYGLVEVRGFGSFPDFRRWTEELKISTIITDDDIPWCGVFVGICAQRTGWTVPEFCYRAKSWLSFGQPLKNPELGCIMIFSRTGGGGHVGFYVGETDTHYAILGGNQSNMVNIMFLDKDRLLGARECPWRISKPINVRPVHLSVNASGELISTNEA